MPAPVRPSYNFTSSFLFDAIIVGGGPAGLSAALALARQKHPTVVFSDSTFRNARALRAHTILSRDHQPAAETRRIGKEQLDAYGTTHFVERAVHKARPRSGEDGFEVEDETGKAWRGRKIVLATGAKDVFPDIEGYEECWGEAIFPCLFCDGIERSDKPAAILGFGGARTLHQIGFIKAMGCPSTTILVNGRLDCSDERAVRLAKAKGAKFEERKVKQLSRLDNEQGLEVVFEDGSIAAFGFLQHTPPTYVAAATLAKDLGVEILPDGYEGTMLKRNEPFGETNVRGVFVAGDAGTLMKQFTVAMTHGVAAGAGVAHQLGRDEDARIESGL